MRSLAHTNVIVQLHTRDSTVKQVRQTLIPGQ